MTYTAPCFSGTCGFCAQCCSSGSKSINSYSEHKSSKPEESESEQRAEDLKKFMFSRFEKELDHYNKTLNKLIKSVDYRSPTDIGFIKKTVFYEDKPDYNKYRLIQKVHGAVCDDQLCKVFYVSAHESQYSVFYPKLPVYTRVIDNNHKLCAVCINR